MRTKLIILFLLVSLTGFSQAFYKRQVDPRGSLLRDTTEADTTHYSLIVAPNGVWFLNWHLDKELRYTYTYPDRGWWWAESEEQALTLMGLKSDQALTSYYHNFQVYIDTVQKIPTIRFMKEWVLGKDALKGDLDKMPVYALVAGSNATTTGQSLTNITGLTVSLSAGSVYEFEASMSVGTSAVTTGTKYGINYSQSGSTIEAQLTGTSTATATKSERINAVNTASGTYLAATSLTGQVLIKGVIKAGANSGNLTIQHLKVTSGTSTVYIGSYLKVIKIQ